MGHVLPELGHIPMQRVTADHIARLVRVGREKGLAPWTIKGMLTPLGRVFALALRRGIISENPIARLQPEELPKGVAKDPPRVLTRDEIAALLVSAADRYRPIIGIAVFAGLRQQEVLGLRWNEIDLRHGVIKVRHQLTRGDPGGAAAAGQTQDQGRHPRRCVASRLGCSVADASACG